jgi:hypothetical protein
LKKKLFIEAHWGFWFLVTPAVNSHRRLPHIYPENRWVFVTWHLHGSLPSGQFAPPRKSTAGEAFAWMDRYLDEARSGPVFLAQNEIAQVVAASLFIGRTGEPFWRRESYNHWAPASACVTMHSGFRILNS